MVRLFYCHLYHHGTKKLTSSIKPLKHIPFNIVIKAISGKNVLKFDENNPEHKEALKVLIQVAEETGRRINEQGIMRTRANEVGNDIERYVLETFKRLEINAQRPRGKSAGYPDIEGFMKLAMMSSRVFM
jgi:hypothetical protein